MIMWPRKSKGKNFGIFDKNVAFCTDFTNFAKEKSWIEAFSDSQAWLAQWQRAVRPERRFWFESGAALNFYSDSE